MNQRQLKVYCIAFADISWKYRHNSLHVTVSMSKTLNYTILRDDKALATLLVCAVQDMIYEIDIKRLVWKAF